jgi:hypothetical protein
MYHSGWNQVFFSSVSVGHEPHIPKQRHNAQPALLKAIGHFNYTKQLAEGHAHNTERAREGLACRVRPNHDSELRDSPTT